VTLSIESLSVSFGDRVVLRDVALHASHGEIVSIMGPSGSGKSTLLRVIAGLQRIDSGSISIGGINVTTTATHRRDVGMVFQDLALFPHLDVAANIAYGLRMHGIAKAQRMRRVDELLELVQLPNARTRSVTSLSGGEQQRVALARSLAPRPKVLLLDEPFSSLDRELRTALVTDIGEVLRAHGTTTVHVTHDELEPGALGATRTLRVEHGQLIPA
jgi:thiamine transport system ATP-binding protein